MAGQAEPPPLFENIDIKKEEEDDDDLFASAVQVLLCFIIFCECCLDIIGCFKLYIEKCNIF